MPIIIEYSDELTHYGRLGMKWGQHIFGKDDSGSVGRKKKRKTLKERFIERRQKRRARKKAEKENLELERRKAILADPNLLSKHKSEFSTEEINQAIERFRAEKNLRAIANETHAEHIKEIRKGYDYTKTVVDYTAASMNAYNNFAKIYNTFSKDGKTFPIIGEKKQTNNSQDSNSQDNKKPNEAKHENKDTISSNEKSEATKGESRTKDSPKEDSKPNTSSKSDSTALTSSGSNATVDDVYETWRKNRKH